MLPGRDAAMPSFLAGGGELGSLIAAHDWSATPLGPIAAWPPSLRTTVGIVVHSAVPMVTLWGSDGIMIYNDAYSVFSGGRHPGLLGSRVREGWPEAARFNDHVMQVGLAGGTLAYTDQEFTLYRGGGAEQVWLNLDYSPVLDERGEPAGVLAVLVETTDRILAERARETAESRVGRVLESMAEAFILLDPEFCITTINREALRFETRPREQIIGRTNWEIWPGLEGSELGALFRRAMAERVAVSLEHRYVWPDGRAAWLEMRAYPSDEGLAVFYRDVTERRRGEDRKAALATLGDRLRDLKEPALIAQAAGEIIGTALEIAQAAYAIIDAGGERTTILAPWRRDRAVASLQGALHCAEFDIYADRLHRGEDIVVEDVLGSALSADRRAIFEQAGIAAFVNLPLLHNGRMVGMIVVSNDTPRAWAEQELAFLHSVADRTWAALQTAAAEADLLALNLDLERQVEQRTAERDRVWRNSRDLLVTAQPDGILRRVSPAWTAILGHHPVEVEGHSFLEFVHHGDAPAAHASFADLAAMHNLTGFESRFKHQDGSARWISWHTSVEDGVIYGYGRDVTAEKQQAKALLHAEEQLRQSQKMEAVGQLTGGLAHDFNNLLTTITGSLELLRKRVEQGRLGEIDRYLGAAQGGARRAAALTHRLLAFSRRQTLDPRPIDANRLVAGMEELLRQAAGPAVTFEIAACADLWTVRADPNQLENALLNLCINAHDAMPNGGRLCIETSNQRLDARRAGALDLPAGAYVALDVTDTGTGMVPEVIARAFDPFFTTKPLGEGTGLGLSMVYGFTRQSGGQIRIRSAVGSGTSICLYLPRHEGAAEEVGDASAPTGARPAASGRSVLVVDDESAVRMLVTEVLEDLGNAAIEAEDGAAALRVLRSDAAIDLLISDVGLPGGMNGRQLADAGRTLRPGLKVLFITGYAEGVIADGDSLEPGTEVLTKPFGLEALAGRIRELLAP